MQSNGKRQYHTCTRLGFYDEPRWLSNGMGTSIGADTCSRCLRALMRLYGMSAGTMRLGKGIYTTASTETVVDKGRFDAFVNRNDHRVRYGETYGI